MENCIGDVEELLGSSVFRRVLRRLIGPPGHQQRERPWRQDTLSTRDHSTLSTVNTLHSTTIGAHLEEYQTDFVALCYIS